MRDKAIDTRGRTMSDMKELTTAVNEVAILLKIPEERKKKSEKKKRTNYNTYIKPSVTSNTLSLRANSRNFVKTFRKPLLTARAASSRSTVSVDNQGLSLSGILGWVLVVGRGKTQGFILET